VGGRGGGGWLREGWRGGLRRRGCIGGEGGVGERVGIGGEVVGFAVG